jgi:PPOX class probable F420-dependent enzyme
VSSVITLQQAAALGATDHGLVIVSVRRADNTIHSSLVNAGVLPHPITGEPVLGFVTYGTVKLANLRKRPQLTASFRSGWQWASVEGPAEIIGPDDPTDDVDDAALAPLLREVFTAAGGSHDNWDEYDRVMREQRRAAVLVVPSRVYGNTG